MIPGASRHEGPALRTRAVRVADGSQAQHLSQLSSCGEPSLGGQHPCRDQSAIGVEQPGESGRRLLRSRPTLDVPRPSGPAGHTPPRAGQAPTPDITGVFDAQHTYGFPEPGLGAGGSADEEVQPALEQGHVAVEARRTAGWVGDERIAQFERFIEPTRIQQADPAIEQHPASRVGHIDRARARRRARTLPLPGRRDRRARKECVARLAICAASSSASPVGAALSSTTSASWRAAARLTFVEGEFRERTVEQRPARRVDQASSRLADDGAGMLWGSDTAEDHPVHADVRELGDRCLIWFADRRAWRGASGRLDEAGLGVEGEPE